MEQKININQKIAFALLTIWWGAFTFYIGEGFGKSYRNGFYHTRIYKLSQLP